MLLVYWQVLLLRMSIKSVIFDWSVLLHANVQGVPLHGDMEYG
jgi:hypothetical protein